MTNILWAASESDAFAGAFTSYTTSGDLDTDYTRAGVEIPGSTTRFNPNDLGGISSAWFHYRWGATAIGSETNARELVRFEQADGTGILRFYQTGSAPNKYLQYWSGAAWVDIGSAHTIATANGRTIDIECTIDGSAGRFALYADGELLEELTGDTDFFGSSGVNSVHGARWGNTNARRASEFIIADGSTLSMRLATLAPTADGTNTAWTGGEAEIDETAYSDADFITSASVDQLESFVMSDLSANAALLLPVAVISSVRGRVGATGPQNVQHLLRSGGTDYFSPNDPDIASSFGPLQYIWHNNPDTASPFTPSEIDALELGVASRT